ncbi:MAG: hypothetical protein ACE5J2_01005 [Nitrososphaerales archaeon]
MEEKGKEKEIEILNEIFAKAASDREFRNMLIHETSSVLERYPISSETKQILKKCISDMS